MKKLLWTTLFVLFLSSAARTLAQPCPPNPRPLPQIKVNGMLEGPANNTEDICPDGGLRSDATIAVGEYWIVVAVNRRIYMFDKATFPPASLPTSSTEYKDFKQILQDEGGTTCQAPTYPCGCVRWNDTDADLFDPILTYNPHCHPEDENCEGGEFALVLGGTKLFLIVAKERSGVRPFTDSDDVRVIELSTPVNGAHASQVGFDSENYYVINRTGNFQANFFKIDSSQVNFGVVASGVGGTSPQPIGLGAAAISCYSDDGLLSYPFISMELTTPRRLYLWEFESDGTGIVPVVVSPHAAWSNPEHPLGPNVTGNTSAPVNCGLYWVGTGARLWGAVQDGGAIVTCQNVANGSNPQMNVVRWYKVNPSTQAVLAAGDFPTTPDNDTYQGQTHATFPWVTSNKYGEVGVSFLSGGRPGTGSDAAPVPGVAVGIALPDGCFAQSSRTTLVVPRSSNSPWIQRYDYMTVSRDPSSGTRFWFAAQYLQSTRTNPCGQNAWNTKIGSFELNVPCDIDFNNDTLFPDTADIEELLSVFAGGDCTTSCPPGCDSVDFNYDCLYPDTADIEAFLNVFAGEPCRP